MALGWLISSVVAAILGAIFVIIIATMNKKVVRNRLGNIDFKKSDIYFQWTRWDYVIIIAASYTFLCITGLFVFLLRGDNIDSPWIQFFIHQTFVFSLITFIWFVTRIAYVFKGIKERWSDEFE
ncbi:hypothetical protein [Oceanobacillus alkalisoli]|uniref:hypothetical protein n=1 Tax=Oceanobacillus alkalisoli TaxID=2925113 RepID=UPI001EEF7FC9|nr:hypothetical protein [Oceanobacillus alkalisoli]MCF3943784.1 hypothetical protein [Oceanobacillus alkalisoli]MCG5103724.1 hypothetical protein [Oceanobacillus alkalisoli]